MNSDSETPSVLSVCLCSFFLLLFAVALALGTVLFIPVALGFIVFGLSYIVFGFLCVVLVYFVSLCVYLLLLFFWQLVMSIYRKCQEKRLLREYAPFIIYILVLAAATFLICWSGEQTPAPSGGATVHIWFTGYAEIGVTSDKSNINIQNSTKSKDQ